MLVIIKDEIVNLGMYTTVRKNLDHSIILVSGHSEDEEYRVVKFKSVGERDAVYRSLKSKVVNYYK